MTRASRKHLLADTLAAFRDAGRPLTAARICDNGDVLLLTEAPAGALPVENDDGAWIDLAGEADPSRAERH